MNKYPGLYNYPHNIYGNAVVVGEWIEDDWMEANLVKTQENWNEDCNGQAYFAGMIAGYSSSRTKEGHYFYSFHDPENKKRVITGLHDIIVDPNPVLADPPAPDPKKYSNVPGGSFDISWFWVWILTALAVGILIGMAR